MNMASICTLISVCILTCIGAQQANSEFVNVHCKSETTGQYGQSSLLECVVQLTQEASRAEIRVVVWKKKQVVKEKKPVLVFKENSPVVEENGYAFAEPSWNSTNMNLSMLISNTAVEHEGTYECMVITDSGHAKGNINLKVTAKYQTPTAHVSAENLSPNVAGVLTCSADGGYPRGEIRWFDTYKTEWTTSAEMTAEKGQNGLFSLSSKLTLYSNSNFKTYICMVYNATGGKEGEVTVEKSDHIIGSPGTVQTLTGNPSKIVAPIVVIGSLIIGLLLLLFFKRRRQQGRRQSTAPLMDQHQEVCTCEIEDGDHQDREKTCNHV